MPLHAEEVLLKNGQTISGRVTGQNSIAVFVATSRGTQIIAKNDIIRIQYVAFSPAQKAQALEAQRQKEIAIAMEWQRIRQFQETEERRKHEEELAAKIRAEKEAEARAAAERAAALRELVAKGQMEKPADEPISYWDFAWRSLVLPGWGHFYLNRPWFGTIYAVSTAGFVAGVYETHRRAVAAKRENHRDAERNFFLAVQPNLLNLETRTAYGYYSTAKAMTVYQHKVDKYNGALAALATLYCGQIIHIIYNGIAWENGLLIVKHQPQGTIDAGFSAAPELPDGGRKAGVLFAGSLTMRF